MLRLTHAYIGGRRLAGALPVIVLCFIALMVRPQAFEAAGPPFDRGGETPEGGGGALPIAAQGAVSAVLGRDDPAYHVRSTGAALFAENPRHDVRARFDRTGARMHVGEAAFGLALTAWGYGESLGPVGAAAPRARANRVEYARGPISEWYVNGPAGLQHGFTLAAPPARRGTGLLTLAVALSGTVTATLGAGRDGLVLGDSPLRYRGLVAFDADGRDLPARMELREGTLRLRVDDAGARYPITIDPFVQQAKLTAADGNDGHFFGRSVAISGDTIVVGADFAHAFLGPVVGWAYVFVEPASGWANATETAKLTASDGAPHDRFGAAVAISGDTIVIGAPEDDIGTNSGQGSAYVFVRPAAGWANSTESAKLTASDGAADDLFGDSVAISGDTIVVGARLDDGNQGSAYVFVRPASGWPNAVETAKLTASDGMEGDTITSVAISGDTIVIGARLATVGANRLQGSAYVYVRPGLGWTSTTETAKLTASDGAESDFFGHSVAISGDTIVVGAPEDDLAGLFTNEGSAYVFVKPTLGWANATQTAKLIASDGGVFHLFGYSVALSVSGDTIVVGSPNGEAAYAFVQAPSGWADAIETQKLTASDGVAADQLGVSVAVGEDAIVVGALRDDVGSNADQGSAYVFGFNNVPAAAADSYSMMQDATLNVPAPGVLANDSDGDGDGLSAVLVSGPSNGVLTLNADGSFTYTPAAGFNGPDSFTYAASDGISESAPATVTIQVSPFGHDVGIAGGGFSISGRHDLSRSGPVETIKIKVKNYGTASEAIGYSVASTVAGDVFSAGCASVTPVLPPGGTFAVAGCTVTYAATGERTVTLAAAHDDGDGALDDDPSNNATAKVVTVKP